VATVLVVDDAPDIRLLIGCVLAPEGFEVVEADSGPEALTRLSRDSLPEVALIDVQMPHMDGWRTLAAIRRDPAITDLRVIMCTVKSSPVDMLRAWQLGCDGYLGKPFAIHEVVEQVRAVIDRGRRERLATREHRLLAAVMALEAGQR
jgi:CheY-like chemotaxis protein